MDNLITQEKVNAIIKKVKPNRNLEKVTDIIEGGYIDSFELMLLITTLQDSFKIDISANEITPENFNSINAIAVMVDTLIEKQQ